MTEDEPIRCAVRRGSARRRALTWLSATTLAAIALHAQPLALLEPDARAHAHDTGAADDETFTPPGASGWGNVAGLRYLEAVRGGASASERLPLVMLIHGLGDEPRTDWLDLVPRDLRARVVMPRGPIALDRGFSWFPYNARSNRSEALAKHIGARAEQLAKALATLRAQRPSLGLPIVAGFSQGGMLSFALAAQHPERLSLAIAISGTLPEPLWPDRPADARTPAIRVFHGSADSTVPIAQTRRLVEHLRKLSYDVVLHESPQVGHKLTQDMRAAVSKLIGDSLRQ
jgi:phospholipase/carboxylesterase